NNDSDFFSDRFGTRSNNSGSHHHHQQQQQQNDDDGDSYRRKDSLPEWSLEDPSCIDVTRVGTFDATGAFHEALDDELMTPLEPDDNDDDGNDQDGKDEEDFFGRKIYKTRKDSDNKNSTTSGKFTETKSNNNDNDGNKSEILSSTSATTKTTNTKPKPIDYFNDPSLSPNYHTRSETKQQKQMANDKTVSKASNDEDNVKSMDNNNENIGISRQSITNNR
ncbi:hypothetical protein BLA29_008618, partial [Euroglyphus maynei]